MNTKDLILDIFQRLLRRISDNAMERSTAVIMPPGHDMNMQVVYRLPRNFTMVDSDCKAVWLKRLLQASCHVFDRQKHRFDLPFGQIENVFAMHLWDDHHMPRSAREYIEDPDRMVILIHDIGIALLPGYLTKETGFHKFKWVMDSRLRGNDTALLFQSFLYLLNDLLERHTFLRPRFHIPDNDTPLKYLALPQDQRQLCLILVRNAQLGFQ